MDIVTPNGFEDSFVPANDRFDEVRTKCQIGYLKRVAEAVLGYSLSDDCALLLTAEDMNSGIRGLIS